MFNALRPLKKYEIYVEGNPQMLKNFVQFANGIESLKEAHKESFDYFKGMRKNWFPLVLLGYSDVMYFRAADVQQRNEVYASFNAYNTSSECHRFYLDGVRKSGNGLIISCSLVSGEDLNSMVAIIMGYFGFNYKLREVK